MIPISNLHYTTFHSLGASWQSLRCITVARQFRQWCKIFRLWMLLPGKHPKTWQKQWPGICCCRYGCNSCYRVHTRSEYRPEQNLPGEELRFPWTNKLCPSYTCYRPEAKWNIGLGWKVPFLSDPSFGCLIPNAILCATQQNFKKHEINQHTNNDVMAYFLT